MGQGHRPCPIWCRSSWHQMLWLRDSTDSLPLSRIFYWSSRLSLGGLLETLTSAWIANLPSLSACRARSSWRRLCHYRIRMCSRSSASWDGSSLLLLSHIRSTGSCRGPNHSQAEQAQCITKCYHNWHTYWTLSVPRRELVSEVLNVKTASHPLIGTFCFVAFHRVNEWLHSYCICWVVFLEIHHVEFVSASLGNVSDGEEVPLRVVEGVVVEVQKQVVLAVSKLFHFAEVSRLKLRVKEQGLVVNVRNVNGFGWRLQILHWKVRCDSASLYWILNELVHMNLYKAKLLVTHCTWLTCSVGCASLFIHLLEDVLSFVLHLQ